MLDTELFQCYIPYWTGAALAAYWTGSMLDTLGWFSVRYGMFNADTVLDRFLKLFIMLCCLAFKNVMNVITVKNLYLSNLTKFGNISSKSEGLIPNTTIFVQDKH
jgi:hypothetical protein